MELTEQDLLSKKKEIENAKTKLSELKGEEKTLLKQLKEDWDCSTLAEAKKKILKLESDAETILESIETKSKVLENIYFGSEEED